MKVTLIKDVSNIYNEILCKSFNNRYLKYRDVKRAIKSIGSSGLVNVKKIGESIEGRDINLIEIGNGEKHLLFWSQMHGNEPTGTMALFDLIRFFTLKSKHDFIKKLLKEFKLFILPLLNPDGAEFFRRENAIGIDLNRDAQKLSAPESTLLYKLAERVNPVVAFNLHDQDKRWIAGKNHPAVISLLAPPINATGGNNRARVFAKKLIIDIYKILETFLPGSISRYNSEFEIRSFGDLLTNKGIPVILIESGKYFNDYSKTIARKLNFIAFVTVFISLLENKFAMNDLKEYSKIPLNRFEYYDLIFKNAIIFNKRIKIKTDLAFNNYELTRADSNINLHLKLEFVGDLSSRWGLKEINCSNCIIEPIEKNIQLLKLRKNSKIKHFLEKSFGTKGNNLIDHLNTTPNTSNADSSFLRIGENANLIARTDNEIKFVILNGVFFEPV